MEDSQAELLASILNSSLYSSSFSHSTSDELHAVESDKDAGVADVVMHGGSDESDLSCFADDVVIGSNVNASDAIARPYVITPGAMLDSGGSDDVLLLTPETVANSSATVDGATVRYGESAGSDALAVASIDSGEIEAAATAGLRVSTEIAACGAVESSGVLLEEHDMCSSGDLVSGEHSIAESFIHVDGSVGDSEHIAERAAEPEQKADLEGVPEKGSEPTERAVSEIMDNAKDTARDAAKDASKKADKAAASAKNAVDEASKDIADASNDAASKAKDIIDSASKSVRDAAASANDRAHDAMSKARESGEKLAKKAKEEATEAEKAVRRQAKCTPPATLKVLGIVAVALAAVSGYYFRLPGRQNQRIGFAGGVASVVVGLGTLATAFIKRNA
ncbi:hypothetical protein EV174_000307 [Coemansia sp. RSA 2320]|nr:hypothetical protein EV174_000307 [Coemansia sp. RSA 2320]